MDLTRTKSVGASSETALLQVPKLRKKRLGTTRGLTKPSTTPTNSPSRLPPPSSTPALRNPLPVPVQGVSAISRGNPLPPHPPLSPVGQRWPSQEAIRVSVISPLIVRESCTEKDPSLDWDNFEDCPSYKDNFAGIININDKEDPHKVTLVDTSISSFSSNDKMTLSQNNSSGPSEPKILSEQEKCVLEQSMQQDNSKLVELKDIVTDMMEDYTADDVRKGNVEMVQKQLDKISDARNNFRVFVRKYRTLYATYNLSNCEIADKHLNDINKSIRDHANLIWTKVESIQDQQRASVPPGVEPIPILETAPTVERTTSVPSGDLVYRKNLYRDQLLYLKEALSLPQTGTVKEHWEEKSDSDICQAMKDLGRWQTSLEKLSTAFREYEKLSLAMGGVEGFESDSEDFEDVRNKVKEVIIAVKAEDSRRNLQTLLPQKSDKIKYPTFSGEVGEDLIKFKSKMEDCFRKNRILESDQLDKLRENLKGQALKRVPESVKALSTAWQNLSEAFGSPMIVLKERLKGLNKLGFMPAETNPNKQISWLLDFESALQDIIDLGSSPDMNMQMGAFGPPVQESILKAFSDNPLKKREVAMAGQNLQPKEKIVSYQAKVKEFRKEIQLTEVESGSCNDKKKSQNTVCNTGMASVEEVGRNDDCRVCTYFQKSGNTQRYKIFENHLGDKIFQCPVFMKLKLKERINVAAKVKLCQYCLDSSIQTDRQHERECKDKRPQYSESWKCASPGCGRHSWVCQVHADNANKKKLKRYSERMFKKGFEFSYPAVLDSMSFSSTGRTSAIVDLEQQVDKELLPLPDGHPMFLFFGAKGRTRSLMVFFDSGCSKFIMRDCIPGKELPASCISKEKIPIGGIGSTTVFAEGEYLVAMETVDGKAQQMQGLAVKNITSDFPQFNLTDAAAEVFRSVPRNKELEFRRCKFPESIGGSVDCLVGIQYNQLQPRLVHMLPSGLAVYKTKLAPHIKGYNYVLGGPHSSFNVWLGQCGNQNNILLENFIAGLAKWRESGPSSLTKYVMSQSEVLFATEKNILDDQFNQYEDLRRFEENEMEQIEQEIADKLTEIESRRSSAEGLNLHSDNQAEVGCESSTVIKSCVDCGEEFSWNFALLEDEKLSRLKHILDSQETGLDISYRCVRCRNCLDCRNAEKVDKISLREEAEDYEIRQSVNLDWARKKIFVSLPLRGKERDFLTSNENRALKVLESQCKKYYADEATRITVNQAFNKLIDKGFIRFLADMTDIEKSKFMHKEVQYFFPWRL